MKSFISLDYLEYLDNQYDDYINKCKINHIEPKNKQEWYKEEIMGLKK